MDHGAVVLVTMSTCPHAAHPCGRVLCAEVPPSHVPRPLVRQQPVIGNWTLALWPGISLSVVLLVPLVLLCATDVPGAVRPG